MESYKLLAVVILPFEDIFFNNEADEMLMQWPQMLRISYLMFFLFLRHFNIIFLVENSLLPCSVEAPNILHIPFPYNKKNINAPTSESMV